MRIVFMGTAEFGVPALEKLIDHHEICAVVSTPSRPQGRGLKLFDSPIITYSRAKNIKKIFTPDDLASGDFVDLLAECAADIFVVAAFRILPRALFSLPRLGTVNIHASLLPAFRGPAPIQRAIEAGVNETGVTIFKIDEGIDTGGVLLQKKVDIGPEETTPELYARLSRLGADALLEALDGIFRGTLFPKAQDPVLSSRAPKLLKNEALIDWRQPVVAVFNKIRAYKPFPGTFAYLEEKRLGIVWARPSGDETAHEPGTIIKVTNSCIEVACGPGSLLIMEVKPEGRKSMSVHDFLLGTTIKEGTSLTWMPVN